MSSISIKNSAWRVAAIASETAEQVREQGRAPRYGHPALTEVAAGYGPCRHCLRTFRVGQENRILFTYDAFTGSEEIPLPGPVYIHEDRCERYREDGGYPVDLAVIPVVMNAYARGQRLLARRVCAAEENKVEAVNDLLQRPETDYIEVRDRQAGCFDFWIERVAKKEFSC